MMHFVLLLFTDAMPGLPACFGPGWPVAWRRWPWRPVGVRLGREGLAQRGIIQGGIETTGEYLHFGSTDQVRMAPRIVDC